MISSFYNERNGYKEAVVNNYFQGNLPSWVILKDQTEDIASLFNSVDCFISSSASMKHFLMLNL